MPITPLAPAPGDREETSVIPPGAKFENITAMVDSVRG